MERQEGRTLEEIKPDHLARYYFARKRLLSGRVLDAACGCGYGSHILNTDCVMIGVDIHPGAIEHAERFFPGPTYICGDITEKPWSGEFSGIVSFETLEHLKDPSLALNAFRESLNGLLICSVPNEDQYPFDPAVFASDRYPHFRHYRPAEFDALLEHSGFKVLERFCQASKWIPEVKAGTDGRFIIYVCA